MRSRRIKYVGEFPSKWLSHKYNQKELEKRQVHTDLLSPLPGHDADEQQLMLLLLLVGRLLLNMSAVGLCQRELGQFFGRVARWAARLYKSDSAINMFDPDSSSEFDTAQKFFEFFNEHRDAKRECSNGRLWARPL